MCYMKRITHDGPTYLIPIVMVLFGVLIYTAYRRYRRNTVSVNPDEIT